MKPYRYTEYGLNYVYLVDGFEALSTAYGQAVSVRRASILDRVMALTIVQNQPRLSGEYVLTELVPENWTVG